MNENHAVQLALKDFANHAILQKEMEEHPIFKSVSVSLDPVDHLRLEALQTKLGYSAKSRLSADILHNAIYDLCIFSGVKGKKIGIIEGEK